MVNEAGINRKLLGEYLRGMRRDAGYKNTESFSQALAEKAGYTVSKETVYRIESGRQEASISYICAACITLNKQVMSWGMMYALKSSACNRWQLIDTATDFKSALAQKKEEEEEKFPTESDTDIP